MKKFIYTLIFLFPIFLFAQIDSASHVKKDGIWYRTTLVQVAFADSDSLLQQSIRNQLYDAGKQYTAWKLEQEKTEREKTAKIRQLEDEYKRLFTVKPNQDSLSNARQLVGNWMLNGASVTITKTLRINSNAINFVSDDLFWININSKKHFFYKRSQNKWDSEGYTLIRVQ